MIPFNPHDYQHDIIDFSAARRRVMLMAGMGTGKTSSTLSVVLARILAGLSRRILVIAPQRVADLTWPDEVAKWTNFDGLTIVRIIGDQYTRHKALATPADIYTINYENIVWLLETLGDKWPFDTVIADESTKLKSYRAKQGGKRAQALATIAARTRYWINLTGTPTPNGLKDLWGQMWFIDGGQRLGKSYHAFIQRWFYSPPGNQYKILPHKHAFDEIMELISDVCISIEAKDYLDLPPLIENVVKVVMPPAAQRRYDEMESDFFTELETGHEVEAFNEGAKLNKCLQIASGAIYTDKNRSNYETLHEEKLGALESIVEEACGMPVLVSYNFRHELDRLKKYFKQGKEFDKNASTLRKWNEGKIPVMFCHPACLHPDTEVLTEFRGWVRIVEVQPYEKVFDGVEFVSHSGCYFSGIKPILDIFGLKMTENHKLLVGGGWVEARHVRDIRDAREKALYKYQGNDRSLSQMLHVWGCVGDSKAERKEGQSKEKPLLPRMHKNDFPQFDQHTCMAHMERGSATDFQRVWEILRALRGKRDNYLHPLARLQGFLRRYAGRVFGRNDVGSNRQLVRLFQRELSLGYELTAASEQDQQSAVGIQRPDDAFSGILQNSERYQRCHTPKTEYRYECGRGFIGLLGVAISETQEISPVYDLVDCGPRNRFVIRNALGEVFISHNSAGHGLNMQDGGNILAFFGSDWNLETHLQIIERIGPTRQVQSGHNRPVYLHHIISDGTVDELVLDVKRGKATVQEAVMEKLKQRKQVSP